MNSLTPYKVNWLDLSCLGYSDKVAIGGLPGCRHRFVARDFQDDLNVIISNEIHYAIILCEDRELDRFGVPNILSAFDAVGIQTEHYPCEYGLSPTIESLLQIIRKIFGVLERGEKCAIISRDGLGRSCVVASALLLHTDDNLSFSDVYDTMKRLLGARAIPTVKQYNFIVDYRQLRDEYVADAFGYDEATDHLRHISR